ncbi:MAG: glycerophosphoryl diester phosphodiesterase [Arenicella sp.]|jgi:glycerophosphoryl diester phosphodiesterase
MSHLNVDTYGHAGEGIRNGRNKYPPNSLEGFEFVFEDTEVEGVEIDIQMTLDSQIVVYHDFNLDENSDGEGCIPSKNWSELENLNIYKTEYKIPTLKEALDLIFSHNRKVYLDVKYYNECSGENVDFNTFNNAFNTVLDNYSKAQKENILINARSMELVNTISDTVVIKSFETDSFDNIPQDLVTNEIDVLTTRLSSMTNELKTDLDANGIRFCLYEIFVRSEVADALEFNPQMIIADKIECALKFTHGK